MRVCMLGIIAIVALPSASAILYLVAYVVVCNHCNRLGNFLDTWYARSMVDELARGLATDSLPCDRAKSIEQHTACEQGLWRHVVDELDRRVHGVGWGVTLHRTLHLDHARSFAAHAYLRRAVRAPGPRRRHQ